MIFMIFYSSLRSLCKTILNNTNPATASACDRAKVLVEILSQILQTAKNEDSKVIIDPLKVLSVATTVKAEQDELQNLKSVLATQGTLRPIFEGQLKQKRSVRDHAIGLRKLVAEAGLKYDDLAALYKSENSKSDESRLGVLKEKIDEANDKDLEELIKLLDKHFIKKSPNNASKNNVDTTEVKKD